MFAALLIGDGLPVLFHNGRSLFGKRIVGLLEWIDKHLGVLQHDILDRSIAIVNLNFFHFIECVQAAYHLTENRVLAVQVAA